MSLTRSSHPYRAVIDVSAISAPDIVAAVEGKQIVVLNVVITVATGNTVIWRSETTDISGPISESYTAGDAHAGLLETVTGEALVLECATADQVSGHLTYVLL